jgi:hypothetical protein
MIGGFIMVYEVKVTVNSPSNKAKNVKTPTALTYLIRCDAEINAKMEALNRARTTQAAHPRKYKDCTFTVEQDSVKQFK